MKKILAKTFKSIGRKYGPPSDESLKLAIGHLECSLLKDKHIKSLADAEFKVFSQWGEDGVIQYLTQTISIDKKVFVEFGVQDYKESNTRFLLVNNNWSGLIIDADGAHKEFLKKQNLSWKYDIQAVTSFITAENINQILRDAGVVGNIGLLSVDIDGVDYWVLDKIDVIDPQIVVVEYNAFMGSKFALSVPYKSDFYRTDAHYSNFYWGASLSAYHHLLTKRGYKFLGCNTAGNNAFFVKRDIDVELPELSVTEGFVDAKFWEYRLADGTLDTTRDRGHFFEQIGSLPLVDVISGESINIKDLDFS